jgi:hypothetical protein
MAGEQLIDTFAKMVRNGEESTSRTDLMYGTVVSVSPIVIDVLGESAMRLTQTFIELSPLCIEKTVKIPSWNTVSNTPSPPEPPQPPGGPSGVDAHWHTIPAHECIVWRGLQPGDRVIMLRVNSGNKYYVIQRVGDYNDTSGSIRS